MIGTYGHKGFTMSIKARMLAAFVSASKYKEESSTSIKVGGMFGTKLVGLPDYVIDEDGALTVSDKSIENRIDKQPEDKIQVKPTKCVTPGGTPVTSSKPLSKAELLNLYRISTGTEIPSATDAATVTELQTPEPTNTDATPNYATAAETTVQPKTRKTK